MKTLKSFIAFFAMFTLASCASTPTQNHADVMCSEYAIDSFDNFKSRLDTLNQDIADKGVLLYTPHQERLLTGYSYHQVYDWDVYFECIYLSYFGVNEFCFNNTKSFLKFQRDTDGFMSRTIDQTRTRQHFKPFLAQIAELGSRQVSDYTWLNEKINDKTIFERLDMSIAYWFQVLDADNNGLPVWNSADHSGMDNQVSRAGALDSFRYEGVDLACYIHREYKAMEAMAIAMGDAAKGAEYAAKADALAAKVNEVFWNEEDGMYYDRDQETGEQVKVKCVSTFAPMWAGIAPKERAERLVKEHLCNTDEFWAEIPVSTYAKSEPDFFPGYVPEGDHICSWRGTTWIPTNYMLIHALNDYGYADIADELVSKTFDMVYKKNDVTREFYNSATGEGLGLPRFWGWSSLGYIMPLEKILGYNPMEFGVEIEPIATKYLNISFPEATVAPYEIGSEYKSIMHSL